MDILRAVILIFVVDGIIALVLALLGYSLQKTKKRSAPLVLIDKGKLREDALLEAPLSVEELSAAARLAGYFNLADIDYAILEVGGEVSFLPAPLKRPLCPKDFNFAPVREGLCTTIVIDGELQKENVAKTGVSEREIMDILRGRGRALEEILFATMNEAGRIDVFEK